MNIKVLQLFPALLFFLSYHWYGLQRACAVLMVATLVVTGIVWLWQRKVSKYSLLNLSLVLFFGSLTLLGGGVRFLQIKVTLVHSLLALTFFVTSWRGKPLVAKLLADYPGEISARAPLLNIICGIFFTTCALLNIYLSSRLSEADWITFKIFGLPSLTFLFATGTLLWIRCSRKRSATGD